MNIYRYVALSLSHATEKASKIGRLQEGNDIPVGVVPGDFGIVTPAKHRNANAV